MDIRKKLYPLKTTVLDLLCRATDPARQFNPEKNLLIFSYPRSGSTWLMELLTQIPGTANLWEPLHLRNVEVFNELDFGWRQIIPAGKEWSEAEETFERLFKGEFLNYWLSSREFPLKFCTADRMLIKFVRANGMLPWLTQQFEFDNSPVYLVRHPFAVAASQMKEGSWDYSFDEFIIPEMPYNDFFYKHERFLSTIESKAEEMVALWCLNNLIVLENQRHDRDWVTVYYENLLLQPGDELNRIFERWQEPMPVSILEQVDVASSTTKETTFRKNRQAQLAKWQSFFGEKEIARMQRILDYFEIDLYSGHTLHPNL